MSFAPYANGYAVPAQTVLGNASESAGPQQAMTLAQFRTFIAQIGVGGVLSGSLTDPGFSVDMATQAELQAWADSLAAVAMSGAYADLTGKPTLGTAAAQATTDFAAAIHGHAATEITSGTLPDARLSTNALPTVTTVGDANYTILSTDRIVQTSAALTTARTWTLPAANAFPTNVPLRLRDFAGGATLTNVVRIIPAGADTINGGAATSVNIRMAYGEHVLWSNGSNGWFTAADVVRGVPYYGISSTQTIPSITAFTGSVTFPTTGNGTSSQSIGGGTATGSTNLVFGLGSAVANGCLVMGQSSNTTAATGADSSVVLGSGANSNHARANAIGAGVPSFGANRSSIGNNSFSNTGNALDIVGRSSTGARQLASLDATWIVSTDASRTARVTLSAYDSASAREGVRVEANGSAVLVGFYGSAAVAKQTVTGSRGSNAALASLLTALANLGLITDSSS